MKLKRFEYNNDGKAELTLHIGALTVVVSAPVTVTVEVKGDAADSMPDKEVQKVKDMYQRDFTLAVDRLLSQIALDMVAMARTKREGK